MTHDSCDPGSPSSPDGEAPSKPPGRTLPARRPIPLPPESLRPAPRERPRVAPGVRGVPALPPRPDGGSAPPPRRRLWPVPLALAAVLLVAGILGREALFRPEPASQGPPAAVIPGATSRLEAKPPGAEPAAETLPPLAEAPAGEGSDSPGRFVLQAASYRTRSKADKVLLAIRSETGLAGVVLPSTVNGERWHRILLGPFAGESEASEAARRLRGTRLVGEALVRPVPPGWDAAQRPEGW